MNSEFEHPIYYVEQKQKLDDNIIEDLELLELSKESDERVSLLETVIKPNSKIGVENLNKLCEYYTDDKSFIKSLKPGDDISFSGQVESEGSWTDKGAIDDPEVNVNVTDCKVFEL